MITLNKSQIKSLESVERLSGDFKRVNGKLEWFDFTVSPTIYFSDDEGVLISAEDGKGFADYYGNSGMEIDASLEKWASDNGFYWDWLNSGTLVLSN